MKGTRKEITWPYIENSHQNYLFGSQGKGSVQKYSASSASFAGILWKIKSELVEEPKSNNDKCLRYMGLKKEKEWII